MLLIVVDKYDRPMLFIYKDSKKVIPIFPVLREWEGTRGTCSRRQFAAALAFAITVYKSQGLTLEWVVLDIKDKDKTPGLTYVAISRVKKLSGILFERGFDRERFQQATSKTKDARQRDFERR